eukprot:5899268-Pleurochrysis_carterae.AAC.4
MHGRHGSRKPHSLILALLTSLPILILSLLLSASLPVLALTATPFCPPSLQLQLRVLLHVLMHPNTAETVQPRRGAQGPQPSLHMAAGAASRRLSRP